MTSMTYRQLLVHEKDPNRKTSHMPLVGWEPFKSQLKQACKCENPQLRGIWYEDIAILSGVGGWFVVCDACESVIEFITVIRS